jgi:iron-sulfur cluster insertion protein
MLYITGGAKASLNKKLNIKEDFEILEKIKLDLIEENNQKKRFRIKVLGGGCSGFQYKFSIDDQISEEDKILGNSQIQLEVIVDQHSLPLISNGIINYNKSISGEYFFIENPNAKSKCGCGNSFTV